MANSNAFTNIGPTPWTPQPKGTYGPANPNTAAGKALFNVGNGTSLKTNTSTPSALSQKVGQPAPSYGAVGTTPGLIAPSTPVKSHTVTNVDGSTTSQTYHPPAPTPAPSQGFGNGTTYGNSDSSGTNSEQAQKNALLQTQVDNLRAAQNQVTQPAATFPGMVNTLAGTQPNPATTNAQNNLQTQATGPNPAQGSINNLNNIAQNGSSQVQQATQNVKGLQQAQTEIANNPNVAAEVASGRGQAVAGQINAAETGLQNALAQQGQQITAGSAAGGMGLTGQQQQIGASTNQGSLANTAQANQIGAQSSAAGLAAPHFNGYVAIDPKTGQPVGGQGGMNSAIQAGASADAAYTGALGSAVDTQSINGAQNNIDSLNDLIKNSPELNKSGINLQNAGYAVLQQNLSSSDRATLNNALDSINQALTKVTGAPIDVGKLSTSQGTSLLRTIDNQIQLAKGIAAGKTQGASSGTSGGGNSYVSSSGNKYNLPY